MHVGIAAAFIRSVDLDFARLQTAAAFGAHRPAAENGVNRRGDIVVHRDFVPVDDLDHHVEGRRRLALQDRLLRAAASRLLVARA